MQEDDRSNVLIQNERDSLHIFSLDMLPIKTPGLKRARIIKNAYLDSVIELFKDAHTGSGQLYVQDLPKQFDWENGNNHPDLVLLRRVAAMPSYDVYSLRIALRDIGIKVNDVEALKLSPEMNKELTAYMTDFTRPLILQIYGKEDGVEIETFEDVVALFRDPDMKRALKKLKSWPTNLALTQKMSQVLLKIMAISAYRSRTTDGAWIRLIQLLQISYNHYRTFAKATPSKVIKPFKKTSTCWKQR